jgi:hypothetical protein
VAGRAARVSRDRCWLDRHNDSFLLHESMRPTLNQIGGVRDGEGEVMAEERSVAEPAAMQSGGLMGQWRRPESMLGL